MEHFLYVASDKPQASALRDKYPNPTLIFQYVGVNEEFVFEVVYDNKEYFHFMTHYYQLAGEHIQEVTRMESLEVPLWYETNILQPLLKDFLSTQLEAEQDAYELGTK